MPLPTLLVQCGQSWVCDLLLHCFTPIRGGSGVKKSSAFDNAEYRAAGQKSLLENYLTDSIHVKC